MMQHIVLKPEAERIEAVVGDGRQRATLCLLAMNKQLDGKTYLLGEELTGVDIVMGWTPTMAKQVNVLTEARASNVWRYLASREERPAYQRANSYA